MANAKAKPKPSVGMYGGLAFSAARAGGLDPDRGAPFSVLPLKGASAAIKGNVEVLAREPARVLSIAVPAAVGVGASWLADKLGINRMLAKRRAPFRV